MLALVERYTTIGVFGWQIKNNNCSSTAAEFFSQQKEKRNSSFSLDDIRPKKGRKVARVSCFVSQKSSGNFTQLCRNFAAPKTLLVANISAIKLGLQ